MTKCNFKRIGWAPLFFPLTILYEELLLRLSAVDAVGFDYHYLYPVIFAAAFGSLLYGFVNLFSSRKVRVALTAVLSFLLIAVFCAEFCVKSYFQIFFEVGYMLSMAGDVTTDFANDTRTTVIKAIPYILAAMYPMLMLAMKHKKIVPHRQLPKKGRALAAGVFLGLELITVLVILLGGGSLREDREYFTADYAINPAITRFGLTGSLQLEAVYGLFGIPEYVPSFGEDPVAVEDAVPTPTPDPVYGANAMDIDFVALAESTKDRTLLELHRNFASAVPTNKNQYTGMFEGKNLIYLVAESFSIYAIDPELTPTLYKLYSEGFTFTDFYQPDWHQSTTGGEFAAVSGLLPTNVNGTLSFLASARKAMPFALGHQFAALGYNCRAYHNNSYNFYERHRTHPNLGYEYQGIGNGLKLISRSMWPNSDHEMILVTADEYIDNYANNGEKFHTYYMTVSGHGAWSWSNNRMSAKHREEVEHLDYSPEVQAYLAANLELEYAVRELMDKLEAAGIADDTVIAITSDHYPYKLTTAQYNELEDIPSADRSLDRYRNAFLLWCGSMEEPVVVNDPCSSIDILPTLSNLFGLEYDSRLFSGRDILSTNYDVADPNSPQPFVVGVDAGIGSSWKTLAGSYDASTKVFTPNPGYEDYASNTEYINAMKAKAKTMFSNAKNIIAKDYYKVVLTPKDADPAE